MPIFRIELSTNGRKETAITFSDPFSCPEPPEPTSSIVLRVPFPPLLLATQFRSPVFRAGERPAFYSQPLARAEINGYAEAIAGDLNDIPERSSGVTPRPLTTGGGGIPGRQGSRSHAAREPLLRGCNYSCLLRGSLAWKRGAARGQRTNGHREVYLKATQNLQVIHDWVPSLAVTPSLG